jgi:predicted MFS family arabinose efflux permease
VGLNFPSAVLLGLFSTLLIYGLTELGRTDGSNTLIVIACAAASVVFLALWVRREWRSAAPLVDLDLLRRREFAFANTLAFFQGAAFLGMFSFVPLYITETYDMSASEIGVLLTPRAVAMVVTAALASLLLRRTGYRKPVIIGQWGMALTLVVLARSLDDPVIAGIAFSSFAWLTLVNGALGFAFGIANPSLQNASLDLAPDRIPAVVALRGMFASLGGTVGVAAIAAATARASSVQEGLELSFIVVAVVFSAAALLIFGIPEMKRATPRPAEAARPATPD